MPTRFLSHFNGSTLVDEAGATLTAVGSAALSTTQKKFGDKSLYCAGAGDYVSTPGPSYLTVTAADTLAVELFLYRNNATTYGEVLDFGAIRLYVTNQGALALSVNGTYVTEGPKTTDADPRGSITAGGWHHIAFQQSGGNYRELLVDGHNIWHVATTPAMTVAGTIYIGGAPSGIGALNGYVDELRISTGTLPYPSAGSGGTYNTYTVPTAEFPPPPLLASVASIGSVGVVGKPSRYAPSVPVSISSTLLGKPAGSYDQFFGASSKASALSIGTPSASQVFVPRKITAWPYSQINGTIIGKPTFKQFYVPRSIARAQVGMPVAKLNQRTGVQASASQATVVGMPRASMPKVGIPQGVTAGVVGTPAAKYRITGIAASHSGSQVGTPSSLPPEPKPTLFAVVRAVQTITSYVEKSS